MRGLIIFFCITLFLSCNNNIYQQYHFFNNHEWNTDSVVSYVYMVSDTTKKYNLSLNIRHTTEYRFQNLFLFLSGDNKDTVEITLANKRGSWLGSGHSDVREVKYIFDKERVFDKRGTYNLNIEQAMRYGPIEKIKSLQHILDIGLIISEVNE